MKMYLRPETLFGTKLDSYLNQDLVDVKAENIELYFEGYEWKTLIEVYDEWFFAEYKTVISDWESQKETLRKLSNCCNAKRIEMEAEDFTDIYSHEILSALMEIGKKSYFHKKNGILITPKALLTNFDKWFYEYKKRMIKFRRD